MIKANELRSGNLVQGKPLSIPRLQMFSNGVTRITAYGIHAIESEQYTNYKPIPLTEEWLIKCGFTKNNRFQLYGFHKDGFGLTTQPDCNFRYMLNYDLLRYVPLNYVHQLQNLYFAIMGKELEIKL